MPTGTLPLCIHFVCKKEGNLNRIRGKGPAFCAKCSIFSRKSGFQGRFEFSEFSQKARNTWLEMDRIAVVAGASDARAVLGWLCVPSPGGNNADESGYKLRRDAVLARAHESSVDTLAAVSVASSNGGNGGAEAEDKAVLVCSASRQEEHARIYVAELIAPPAKTDDNGAGDSALQSVLLDLSPQGAVHCIPASDAGIAAVGVFREEKQPEAADAAESAALPGRSRVHVVLGSAVQSDPLTGALTLLPISLCFRSSFRWCLLCCLLVPLRFSCVLFCLFLGSLWGLVCFF
jgi:hypothetical protein